MSSSSNHKVLHNSAFLFTGRLISRVLQFILFIVAARVLGAESFGVFSVALAMVCLFTVGFDLGVSEYCIQQLSRRRALTTKLVGRALLVKGGLVTAVAPVVITAALLMHRDPLAVQAVAILALWGILDALSAVFHAVFEAHERMIYSAAVYVFGNVAMSLIGLAALAVYGHVLLFCTIYTLGGLLRLLLAFAFYRSRFGSIAWSADVRSAWEMLRHGIPFAMVTLFITVYYYIDVLILNLFEGDAAVGYYCAAYRLIEAPLFVSAAVATAVFPAASRLYSFQQKSGLQRLVAGAFEKMAVLAFTGALAVAFFAQPLVARVYGPGFQASAAVLPVLIFSTALIMPGTICGTALRAMDQQGFCARVAGSGAAVNIGLNFMLIPRFSYMGAAWATLLTEALVLAIYLRRIHQSLGPVFEAATALKIAGLIVIGGGGLRLLQGSEPWIRLVASAVLLAALLWISGLISFRDLRHLSFRPSVSE